MTYRTPPTRRRLAAGFLCALALGAGSGLCAQTDFRSQAFAAAKAGDHEKAGELFFRLIQAGAEDLEILAAGSRSLEQAGRLNDALTVLKKAVKKFPDTPAFRVGVARVFNVKAATTFRDSGKFDSHVIFNYEDAAREAKVVLGRWPDNRDARLILAHSLFSLGKWDAAKDQAEELRKRFPTHPGGHIVMGDLAFQHYKLLRKRAGEKGADTSSETMQKIVGSREAARISYRKAIELDPNRVVAHRKLGDVYAWNAEIPKAIECYGNALRIAPMTNVSHEWIQRTLAPKERFAFYEKLGKEYMAKPGADRKEAALFAWYGAAALLADRRYQAGEDLYLACATMNPRYTTAYYYAMYTAYYHRNDVDAALRHALVYASKKPIEFSDVIRGTGSDNRESLAKLIRYLAKLALDRGNPAGSRDLNHVLAAVVDTADAWNNFAFMARESKQYEASEAAYRNALEIEPTSGQLKNDLAVILHYHKGTPEAFAEAQALYQSAIRAAKATLAKDDVTAEARRRATKTIADATLNLEHLAKLRKTRQDKAPQESGSQNRNP